MKQTHESTPSPDDRNERRPYVKPEFRHESVFETMALACGKISGTQVACNSRRNAS